MKILKLTPTACQKLYRGEVELSEKDITELPKGLIPGEWLFLSDEKNKIKYLSYINPHAESYFKIKVLSSFQVSYQILGDENTFIWQEVLKKINHAISLREIFIGYENGCRLVYGSCDRISGLIVDKYKKYILIQINTAGLDRFREEIKKALEVKFPKHKVILFDNVEYRKHEVLPIYETEKLDEELEVEENGIKYLISRNAIQKIGFYYDHRENRRKLLEKINRLNLNKKTGLDLFSYVGSWGLHLLKSGIENVEFVDQGDMEKSVQLNLKLNNFDSKGSFVRKDVFKYLDEQNSLNRRFDVVVSDPPAFTKSEKNKTTAIVGYEKLHQKALKLVNNMGLFVAASCTHYVDEHELDKTVQDAARRNSQTVQLLDTGVQGHDHPIFGFNDKGFYIKYLLYLVKREDV